MFALQLTVTVADFIITYLVSVVFAVFITKPFCELTILMVRSPQSRRTANEITSTDMKTEVMDDRKDKSLNYNGVIECIMDNNNNPSDANNNAPLASNVLDDKPNN